MNTYTVTTVHQLRHEPVIHPGNGGAPPREFIRVTCDNCTFEWMAWDQKRADELGRATHDKNAALLRSLQR